MKKIIILATAFTACFFNFQLYGKDRMATGIRKGSSHGNLIYGSETVRKVQNNGFVALNGTTVTERLQVNGRLKAEGAQITAMQVNGQTTLDKCSVSQKSTICGSLIAKLSQFSDTLSVSSEKVMFNSCTLNDLHIIQVGGYQGTQVIELRGKTKVNGSITFEAGNGEVIIDPGCEIVGSVIGGKIRKQ